jgi:hypothetical protein
MIKAGRFLMILTVLMILSTLSVASELPERGEYAFGFPLITEGDSEFFTLDLPTLVYRSVSDPSLRDAGVFNADGQAVPRVFEHTPPMGVDIEKSIPLGLVPLLGEQTIQPEQLRLLLRRDASGTVLEYETPETSEFQQADGLLVAYIIDARELDIILDALELTWPDQGKGFIGRVSVDDSNDLQKWRRLTSASLADLNYEDTVIIQNRVNLGEKTGNFLRITWHDMPENWALDSVTGIHTTWHTPIRRESVSLNATEVGESGREYVFDIGGYPPIDRVNLLLPGENIVVRATVSYRLDGQDYWRQVHDGLFYNITRRGNEVQSAPALVNDIRARHWKVRIDSGQTNGQPRLQVGWHPDRLVFLAQGPGPFELVAGRAGDRLEQFPQQRVLGDSSIFRMLHESGEAGSARIGPRMEIAGAERLEIAATSPLRIAMLWLGLAGAILFVGWLVWSLSREMQ